MKQEPRQGSHTYQLWVEKGQAILGDFAPKGTVTSVGLIRLCTEPPAHPSNEIDIYLPEGVDLAETARTFRRIAEGIEAQLYPPLDWDEVFPIGLGVVG